MSYGQSKSDWVAEHAARTMHLYRLPLRRSEWDRLCEMWTSRLWLRNECQDWERVCYRAQSMTDRQVSNPLDDFQEHERKRLLIVNHRAWSHELNIRLRRRPNLPLYWRAIDRPCHHFRRCHPWAKFYANDVFLRLRRFLVRYEKDKGNAISQYIRGTSLVKSDIPESLVDTLVIAHRLCKELKKGNHDKHRTP